MKNLVFFAFTAAVALTGSTSSAQEKPANVPTNVYLLGSFGQSRVSVNQGEFDAASAAIGNAVSSTTSNTSLGWKLGVGYQFNQRFAVEGTYVYFNGASYRSAGPGAFVGVNFKPNSWNLFGVATLPVTPKISGFVKAGVAQTRFSADVQQPLGYYNAAPNRTNLAWGLGGQYALGREWALRVEYENFGSAGTAPNFSASTGSGTSSLSMFSAGVRYNF